MHAANVPIWSLQAAYLQSWTHVTLMFYALYSIIYGLKHSITYFVNACSWCPKFKSGCNVCEVWLIHRDSFGHVGHFPKNYIKPHKEVCLLIFHQQGKISLSKWLDKPLILLVIQFFRFFGSIPSNESLVCLANQSWWVYTRRLVKALSSFYNHLRQVLLWCIGDAVYFYCYAAWQSVESSLLQCVGRGGSSFTLMAGRKNKGILEDPQHCLKCTSVM